MQHHPSQLMRRRMANALMLALMALLFGGCASGPTQIRVLSYNIHHGEGTDGVFDLPRLASVISDAQPDLVSLQEVDRNTNRAGGVDQAAELARLTGMHHVYGPAMDYDGGEYGVAILSSRPISSHTNHPLPFGGNREPRTALAAHYDWPGVGPLTFVATHWQHNSADDRLAEAKRVDEIFGEDAPHPIILVGDLNARPNHDPINLLRENSWDDAAALFGDPAPTFPSHAPDRRIDYVMLQPAQYWQVVEVIVIDEPIASDHCPLLVVLEKKELDGE